MSTKRPTVADLQDALLGELPNARVTDVTLDGEVSVETEDRADELVRRVREHVNTTVYDVEPHHGAHDAARVFIKRNGQERASLDRGQPEAVLADDDLTVSMVRDAENSAPTGVYFTFDD